MNISEQAEFIYWLVKAKETTKDTTVNKALTELILMLIETHKP